MKNSLAENNMYKTIQKIDINPLMDKGGIIKVLISPKTVNCSHLIMGVVELEPGESIIEHIHEYSEEAIYVKTGMGIISIDGIKIDIFPDSSILVPRNKIHYLMNTGSEKLEIVFASSPLAPSNRQGDKIIKNNNSKQHGKDI